MAKAKKVKAENKFNNKYMFLIICIIFITAIAFYPCLNNGLTNLDDNKYVLQNPLIRELDWQNIKKIFTSSYANFYHPITILSYGIEYKLCKLNPFIYHLTNYIFHLLNTLLVFQFIYLLVNNFYIASITSLLFGIHPLHVESVAWVSERKDVLSTAFFLGSLIFYLYYIKKENKNYYYYSVILSSLSLLSKPMAITMPLLLLFLDYFLQRKFDKRILLEKIPYIILTIIFSMITLFSFSSSNIKSTFIESTLIGFYGILFYLCKTFLPLNLSCMYLAPVNGILSSLAFILSPFLVFLLAALIIYSGKYTKKIIFAFAFYLITILPVLQFIRNTYVVTADRYFYIPSIGIFYLIGEGIVYLYLKSKYKALLISIFSIFIIVLSGLSWARCSVWKDSMTLWNNTLKTNPYNFIAYNNRGNIYIEMREDNKALEDFNKAIDLNPFYAEAYNNRGNLYRQSGENNKALDDFNKALEIKQNYDMAYNNRGSLYRDMGEYDKAISDLNYAIKINPFCSDYYNNRAIAFAVKKEYDKALTDFNTALIYSFSRIDIYYNRAGLYEDKGEYDRAIEDINMVLKLSSSKDIYTLYGFMRRGDLYKKSGQYELAINDYTNGLSLNPEYLDLYNKRMETYILIKDYKKASNDLTILEKNGYKVNPEIYSILRNNL